MRTAAILPVKRFSLAKQRLGATVSDPLRLDLAQAMVGDVLVALRDTAAINLTIVVTSEPSAAAAAEHLGGTVIEDTDDDDGQSAAVTLGIARALAVGIERALCIPGDCPALDPAELDALLSHGVPGGLDALPPSNGFPGEVVVIPDRHGAGTNGLLLTPPDAIPPSFGPGSCARHRELARTAGVACRVERPASLLLDIDTGDDLNALRERLAGEHTRAPRTRTVLGLVTPSRPILTSRLTVPAR
jgi:2-phospho-L-lactate guanylyltransferase